MDFTEELLHFVWKSGMLRSEALSCHSGESLKILQTGTHNLHSGPDFENVRLQIGDTLWAGNVEMHLRSSDWYVHCHQQDKAYENVILHVVYQHDKAVYREDGTEIPVLELHTLIPEHLIYSYRDLMKAKSWIPCASALANLNAIFTQNWLNRVLIERLENKYTAVLELVKEQRGSWDNAFYINAARNFGFKQNALAFECLARSLPQTLLARHKDKPLQLEALLFGQAGMLDQTFEEDYPSSLRENYHFLRTKYAIQPLESSIWRFMRLRPANFPTIPLAQFAALTLKSNHLFSEIIEIRQFNELSKLFSDLPINPYWRSHYHFGKSTALHSIQIGKRSIENLLINSVAVFLFAYGHHHQNDDLKQRALQLLEMLKPEQNQIVTNYAALGLKVNSASGSQALLELKQGYCEAKKCLSCGIGIKILSLK